MNINNSFVYETKCETKCSLGQQAYMWFKLDPSENSKYSDLKTNAKFAEVNDQNHLHFKDKFYDCSKLFMTTLKLRN